MSVSRKILSNTAYYALGRVWMVGVNLFLTPLILSYLGTKQFATWALFWTFSSYFMFMDMGLGTSLARDVAVSSSEPEPDELNQAFNTVLVFYYALGAICLFLAWTVTPWLLMRFKVSPSMHEPILDVAHWGAIVFTLIGIVQVLTQLLQGFQRFDYINKVMLLVSVPNMIGIYLVLEAGFGLPGLLWVTASVYTLQILILARCARRVFPPLRFGVHRFSWSHMRKMLSFGGNIQVSRFADLVSYQADKLLLALLVPVSFVTMYDLGAKVSSLVRNFPYILTSAVFPAASKMHGEKDFEKLWLLYDRGSKYLLLVTLPMLLGLWLTAPMVIGLWLGHVSTYVYQAVMILSFAYWITVSLAMVYNISIGMGWVKPIMQTALLQAFVNLGLSFVLIVKFGFIGALCGTAMAIMLSGSVLYFRFCRQFDRPAGDEWRRFWRVMRANILPFVCCLLYVGWVDTVLKEGDRLQSLWALLGAMLIYALLYALSLRWLGLFDARDEELMGGYLPMVSWFVPGRQRNGGG